MSRIDNSSADESPADRANAQRDEFLNTFNRLEQEAEAKAEAVHAKLLATQLELDRAAARGRVVRGIITLASGFIFVAGASSLYLYFRGGDQYLEITQNPIIAYGLIGMFLGATGLMVLGVNKARADISFLDLDNRRTNSPKSSSSPNAEDQRLRDEYFAYVPGQSKSVEYANEAVDMVRTPFEQHIIFTIGSLNEQMKVADMKSSHLLDRGAKYIKNGIMFYVASILIFQLAGHLVGVSNLMVAGIVSCSLTFLVIEFLAAWFLRQYKAFVDSSTNLLRVISIYNSILLSYHGIKEFAPTGEGMGDKMRAEILEILSREIKWPHPTPLKGGDVSHMVEMFDSLGIFMERTKGVFQKPASKPAEEAAV